MALSRSSGSISSVLRTISSCSAVVRPYGLSVRALTRAIATSTGTLSSTR
ncbi:Uncharacterised protein [Mycobacteroides abscessus subsp. abscessus]|nr:Uncharacterised protein [Mycobacteroides abscessus subsp. abscessus]